MLPIVKRNAMVIANPRAPFNTMVKTMHHGTTTVAFRTSSTREPISSSLESRVGDSTDPYGTGHHSLTREVSLLFEMKFELPLTEEREDPTE